ncbi:MAG: hypothetical protein WA667_21225 [Candidatus Nitrosopolaris sp.]
MHENANTRVGQKEGLLIGFDTNKDGSSLLAVVKIDINKYKVAADTATRILLVVLVLRIYEPGHIIDRSQ